MDTMGVAYEDDIPKNRGPKVPGHCALDTRLGAPILLRHTVYICIYPEIINCNTYHLLDFLMLIDDGCGRQTGSCVGLKHRLPCYGLAGRFVAFTVATTA